MAKSGYLLAGIVASLATGVSSTSRAAPTRVSCGVERWTVKTLQNRPVLRPARTVNIKYLVTRPKPVTGERRLAFEHQAFTVTAAVTLVRPEDDGRLAPRVAQWAVPDDR